MKILILVVLSLNTLHVFAQGSMNDTIVSPSPLISFDDYLETAVKAKEHRKTRLVSFHKFREMAKEPNTIILDTRSDSMYNLKHIEGAIHLNFSDFTQKNLAQIIPNKNTRILIYCNNNIMDDEVYFPSKAYRPIETNTEDITLALNIPTYINLYGYGYENVYELLEIIAPFPEYFEGTAVER